MATIPHNRDADDQDTLALIVALEPTGSCEIADH